MDKILKIIWPILICTLVLLIFLSYRYRDEVVDLVNNNGEILEESNNEVDQKEDKIEKPIIEVVDSGLEVNKLNISIFIPNSEYEVKSICNDLTFDATYIKGNGQSYEVIGTSGKGPMINVYTNKEDGLYKVYSGDLSDDEISNKDQVNYLDKRDKEIESLILKEPIEVGTRWDNKEIVEVGENLKLNDITLEGYYVKTWEKETNENDEIIKVYYYSEGLGCVKYKILLNGKEMEYSILNSIIKK